MVTLTDWLAEQRGASAHFFLQCPTGPYLPALPRWILTGPLRVVYAGNAGLVPSRRRPPFQPLGLLRGEQKLYQKQVVLQKKPGC